MILQLVYGIPLLMIRLPAFVLVVSMMGVFELLIRDENVMPRGA